MSLVAAPQCCLARSAAGPAALRRANPVRAAAASSARLTRRSARVATSAVLSPDQAVQAITDGHAALFQLSANANDLVDGCGVNGTCGQVDAPPFALIGAAIVISAAVLFSVTFGLKPGGGADAASEMQERDESFFGKKK